jgi:two-component system, NarL family, sensor kinase
MTRTPRSRQDAPVSRNGTEPSSPATWAWAAVVVGVVNALALIVTGIVGATSGIHSPIIDDGAIINLVAGPTFPFLAALILRSRDERTPRRLDRLAWLFVGLGVLCTATAVVFTYAAWGLLHGAPLTAAAVWVEGWLWTSVVPGVEILLLWFPTGTVVGPRWRWAVWGAVAADACLWLGTAFTPGPDGDFGRNGDNPLGSAAVERVLGPVGVAGQALLAVVFLAAIASLVVRYWRGDALTRAQLRWLLVAVTVIAVTIAVPATGFLGVLLLVVNILATVLLPVTLAVALTRAGFALPRVLVYGLLSTLLLLAYLAVVGGADALLGGRADRAAALVAAGLVAVLVAPVRTRLQRSVDRLVYGDRGDPYAVLSDLGRRIVGSPDDLLAEVVTTVARALHTPYVAVELTGEEAPAARTGEPAATSVVVPLSVRGQQVGRLLVAQRNPREAFGSRDLRLLDELARPIAVAAHAAALTRDLQHSRESLVIAREEERRRIRRDLHDGLGPALAGVALGLDAARNTLRRDPAGTERTLTSLKAEVQASLADVRRLVYDLRPPALDRQGLVAAVEEYAARLRERTALEVTVSAPPLPPLIAAAEVAAFRIITEALTNVVRHSGARRAGVVVSLTGSCLRLTVTDDGSGLPDGGPRAGVGITAMTERAEEIGGTCVVMPGAEGGTAVVAELPLREMP